MVIGGGVGGRGRIRGEVGGGSGSESGVREWGRDRSGRVWLLDF